MAMKHACRDLSFARMSAVCEWCNQRAHALGNAHLMVGRTDGQRADRLQRPLQRRMMAKRINADDRQYDDA
jgi:hypothetical protein